MTSEVSAPHVPQQPSPTSVPRSTARTRAWAFAVAAGGLGAALAITVAGVGAVGTWGASLLSAEQLDYVGYDVWGAATSTAQALLPAFVLLLLASMEQYRRGRRWLMPTVAAVLLIGWCSLSAAATRVVEDHLGDRDWSWTHSDFWIALAYGHGTSDRFGSWPGAAAPWLWADDHGATWSAPHTVIGDLVIDGGTHRVASVGLLTPLVIAAAAAVVIWAGHHLGARLRPGPATSTWARTVAILVALVPVAAVLVASGATADDTTSWGDIIGQLMVPAAAIVLAVLTVGLHRTTWVVLGVLAAVPLAASLSQWWAGGEDRLLLEGALVVVPPLACCAAVPLARWLTGINR